MALGIAHILILVPAIQLEKTVDQLEVVLGQKPVVQILGETSWVLSNQTNHLEEDSGVVKSSIRLVVSLPPGDVQLDEPTIGEVGILVERPIEMEENSKVPGRIVWVRKETE